jgi:hypothetical protein
MKKICAVVIEDCRDCPFYQDVDRLNGFCERTRERMTHATTTKKILEICPLPNAPEEK